MDEQRQDDQLEPTYNSSLLIRNVVLKTCLKPRTREKGGETGSVIFVLMARRDDNNTYRLCSHTIKCQNSSILNNSV